MTKTTEELKRAMFEHLEIIKEFSEKPMLCRLLETALEEYLEQLRQEYVRKSSQFKNAICLLEDTTEERDELRNRLQAFEFANKSAGEFLQESRAKCKRLKEKLHEARKELSELRESAGSTSGQDSEEVVSEAILGPIQRICQHSFRVHHAYPSGKLESQCIFCLKIED